MRSGRAGRTGPRAGRSVRRAPRPAKWTSRAAHSASARAARCQQRLRGLAAAQAGVPPAIPPRPGRRGGPGPVLRAHRGRPGRVLGWERPRTGDRDRVMADPRSLSRPSAHLKISTPERLRITSERRRTTPSASVEPTPEIRGGYPRRVGAQGPRNRGRRYIKPSFHPFSTNICSDNLSNILTQHHSRVSRRSYRIMLYSSSPRPRSGVDTLAV